MPTANYPPIIVTGPQRSGTTIATQILAADLQRTAVDESEFIMGKDYTNCVLQLPQAMDNYIYFQHVYLGVQFCFVRRDPDDIIRSMKRIQWCRDDVHDWDDFLIRYVHSKFLLWELMKEQIPSSCSEIEYSLLSDHPLFVHDRTGFTCKQWQPNQPIGPKYWSSNNTGIDILYGSRRTQCTTG